MYIIYREMDRYVSWEEARVGPSPHSYIIKYVMLAYVLTYIDITVHARMHMDPTSFPDFYNILRTAIACNMQYFS